jgi:hypothetical protein
VPAVEGGEARRDLVGIEQRVDDAGRVRLAAEVGTAVDPAHRRLGASRPSRERRDERPVEVLCDRVERLARRVAHRLALQHLARRLVAAGLDHQRLDREALEHAAQEGRLEPHPDQVEPTLRREPEGVGQRAQPGAGVARVLGVHDDALAARPHALERAAERLHLGPAERRAAHANQHAAHREVGLHALEALEHGGQVGRQRGERREPARGRGHLDQAAVEPDQHPVARHARGEGSERQIAQQPAQIRDEPARDARDRAAHGLERGALPERAARCDPRHQRTRFRLRSR